MELRNMLLVHVFTFGVLSVYLLFDEALQVCNLLGAANKQWDSLVHLLWADVQNTLLAS